ncbi:MAG: class I SAM-dependent methyltransferase [Nocardiopsaceae bacterium]|nr:class I SAM-dependent methyltransferase [Nocardiopsaceae bacterium]
MSDTPDAPLTGTTKANFTDIYTQPDPRRYYKVLSRLDYQIPRRALPVFREVLEVSRRDGRSRTVLDVCCSYGVNSAHLFAPDDRQPAAAWYADREKGRLSPEELAEADRHRYAGRHGGLTVLGLDASAPAIGYARRAGLLTWGWAEDLESGDPSPELAAGIADTELIISTGGVGYVTRRTFERLLRVMRAPENLWLAIFVLRVFDYSPIADLLASYGLVTENLGTTFRQRRFANDAERAAALHDVRRRGLDPAGKEASGWFHTDCFLTRPAAEAEVPAADLLAPALREAA